MLRAPSQALPAAALVVALVAGGCGSGNASPHSSSAGTARHPAGSASRVSTTAKPRAPAHRPIPGQRRGAHLPAVIKPLHRIPPPTGGATLAKRSRTKAQLRSLGAP